MTYNSVVVELGRSDAGIDIELSTANSHFASSAYIDYNQSFVYKNGVWVDLADAGAIHQTGNLCIKAFTDKSGTSIGKVGTVKNGRTTKNSAKLNWAEVSGAKGYEVYRATSKKGTYKNNETTPNTY